MPDHKQPFRNMIGFLIGWSLVLSGWAYADSENIPLPHHPGQVFLFGERIRLDIPTSIQSSVEAILVLDDCGTKIKSAAPDPPGDQVSLGNLDVGWYRIEFVGEGDRFLGFTTAAVLEPMPPFEPDETPVAVDAALSWTEGASPKDFEDQVSLARLAGVGWIRDRLHWREIQPSQRGFVETTKYDHNARLQTDQGMKVLQTFHGTPEWAVEEGGRRSQFPADLGIVYRFARGMSERFHGTVQGWEPWNEANADNFGGHTVDEMCSYQKAAYLGFKAGDSTLTVCWNPCGGINTESIAEGVLRNRTWPYFDVYSIHSYDWPEAYRDLWESSRKASSGRPIWVTECDRGMNTDPTSPAGDFTEENDRRKGEFIAQSYLQSIAAGSSRHFHFLLHDYKEQGGAVQFGLLRKDLTPRRSYVALATLGRMLHGAQYLGRWIREETPEIQIHAFRGSRNGIPKDLLVGWSEVPGDWDQRGRTASKWHLPPHCRVEETVGHLGRSLGSVAPDDLTPSAAFLVLPLGETDKLRLAPRPTAEWREGEPAPIVLQLRAPDENRVKRVLSWTQEHERTLKPGEEAEFEIFVYNLGENPEHGRLELMTCPPGWEVLPPIADLSLEPMERKRVLLSLHRPLEDRGGEDRWLEWEFLPQSSENPHPSPARLAARVIDPTPDEP